MQYYSPVAALSPTLRPSRPQPTRLRPTNGNRVKYAFVRYQVRRKLPVERLQLPHRACLGDHRRDLEGDINLHPLALFREPGAARSYKHGDVLAASSTLQAKRMHVHLGAIIVQPAELRPRRLPS